MVYNPYRRPQLGRAAVIDDAGMNPREIEAAAFSVISRALREANTPHQRVLALGRNHRLWSIIVTDVASEGCNLPPVLRDDILRLGLFSMRQSIAAMGDAKRGLTPLLEINADMESALRTASPAAALPLAALPAIGTGPSPRQAALSA